MENGRCTTCLAVFLMKKNNMNFNELESQVLDWLKARYIIPNATPVSQLLKAVSEMGELADATNKLDKPGIKDGVGDVLVCLISFCALQGLTLTECLESAYNEIRDRRGTLLPTGVFVKEGDELFALAKEVAK